MRAPQYQIVAVKGLIDTEEQYQVSDIFVLLLSFHVTLMNQIWVSKILTFFRRNFQLIQHDLTQI